MPNNLKRYTRPRPRRTRQCQTPRMQSITSQLFIAAAVLLSFALHSTALAGSPYLVPDATHSSDGLTPRDSVIVAYTFGMLSDEHIVSSVLTMIHAQQRTNSPPLHPLLKSRVLGRLSDRLLKIKFGPATTTSPPYRRAFLLSSSIRRSC